MTASGSGLVHFIFGDARLVDDLLLQRNQIADALLRHLEGVEQLLLGDLERAALHHVDRVLRPAHHEVDRRELELRERGIQDPLPVDPADTHGRQRSVPRHRRQGQRGRGGQGGEHIGIVFLVGRQDGDEHLDFVLEALGKQWADAAVDQPAGKNLLVRRTALTLQEPAGNLAGCVRLFAILDRKREERQRGDVGGDGNCRQYHGVAKSHEG